MTMDLREQLFLRTTDNKTNETARKRENEYEIITEKYILIGRIIIYLIHGMNTNVDASEEVRGESPRSTRAFLVLYSLTHWPLGVLEEKPALCGSPGFVHLSANVMRFG